VSVKAAQTAHKLAKKPIPTRDCNVPRVTVARAKLPGKPGGPLRATTHAAASRRPRLAAHPHDSLLARTRFG